MAKLDFSKWCFNRLASLVEYVNSGTDIVGATVQAALTELANRNFGKNYGYNEVASFSTGSTSPVTAISVVIPNAPAGTYRGSWSWVHTNSKANTNSLAEVLFNGTDVLKDFEQMGTNLNSINGFSGNIDHPAQGDLTLEIVVQKTSGNGLAQLTEIRIDCWRIN